MKRVLPTLMIAALGTGCIDNSPQTAVVDLWWEFWRYAPAQVSSPNAPYVVYDQVPSEVIPGPDRACTQSLVDTIVVSYLGYTSPPLDCIRVGVQGAELPDVPSGTVTFTITAYRGAKAVFEWSGPLDVSANQANGYTIHMPGLHDAFGLYAAFYDFNLGATLNCDAAGNPAVSYTLTDSQGIAVVSVGGPSAVSCSSGATPPLLVNPTGYESDFDFEDYTVRMQGFIDATLTFDSCDTAAPHWAADSVTATLQENPLPTCP